MWLIRSHHCAADLVHASAVSSQALIDTLHFAIPLGDMGAVEDLLAIAKSLDPAVAQKPLAGVTLKGVTTATVEVTADRTSPSDVTPLNALEVVFFLLARLCAGERRVLVDTTTRAKAEKTIERGRRTHKLSERRQIHAYRTATLCHRDASYCLHRCHCSGERAWAVSTPKHRGFCLMAPVDSRGAGSGFLLLCRLQGEPNQISPSGWCAAAGAVAAIPARRHCICGKGPGRAVSAIAGVGGRGAESEERVEVYRRGTKS